MSFRRFIFYCAVCGGCAALVGWVLGRLLSGESLVVEAALKGMFLGAAIAFALGLVDALWSFSLSQLQNIVPRVGVAAAVGALGGLFGGAVGQAFIRSTESSSPAVRVVQVILWVFGWTITGLLIGSSLGVYDMLARVARGEDQRGARRKVRNGLIGGTVGGLLGGTLFLVLKGAWTGVFQDKPVER